MCEKPVATFNGWMPNGVKTYIPIPLDGTPEDFDRILNYQNIFLSRGFVLEDPAFGKLEAGEKREKVNGVLRRKDQKNSDGTYSPTFDLYPDSPALGRRVVIINLDSAEDTAEFQRVTGYKVTDFEVYPANQLNRKDDPADYAKYAKPIHGNVSVVFKDNPAYDPTAEKKKRQYHFVRWEVANETPQPAPAQPAEAASAKPVADPPRNARLENEELVITAANKVAVVQGMNNRGGDRYEGWGKIEDGGAPIPVCVDIFPEDVTAIRAVGYEFREGDGLHIPVVLKLDRGMTRIASVTPRKGTPTDNFNWSLVWPKVRPMYKNTDHMQNSVTRLKNEGAFKNCADEAAVIAVIVAHKNGQAEGTAS